MTEVIQFLLGLLGGTVGAVAGAFIALRKRRSETAFDRRLKWCEDGLKSLQEAGSALVSAHDAPNGSSQAEGCWNEAIGKYELLIPVYGQRVLYASGEGCRALTQFMEAFHDLIEVHLRGDGSEEDEACNTCIRRLQDAGMALSMEARKHLDLDPLPPDLLTVEAMFQGSFKGRMPW